MLYKEALVLGAVKAMGSAFGKGIAGAAKIPFGAGKVVGSQLIKRPKTVLGIGMTGLIAKDNISSNLTRVNPGYVNTNNINI